MCSGSVLRIKICVVVYVSCWCDVFNIVGFMFRVLVGVSYFREQRLSIPDSCEVHVFSWCVG